jgi:hypothetical protein
MSSRHTTSVPRCWFSQNALLWFEVLPDAHRFVAGAPRCCPMQRDPSPGRQAACNSPSQGTRFRQSRQSRPEHPCVSDRNQGCCWCLSAVFRYSLSHLLRLTISHYCLQPALGYFWVAPLSSSNEYSAASFHLSFWWSWSHYIMHSQ